MVVQAGYWYHYDSNTESRSDLGFDNINIVATSQQKGPNIAADALIPGQYSPMIIYHGVSHSAAAAVTASRLYSQMGQCRMSGTSQTSQPSPWILPQTR